MNEKGWNIFTFVSVCIIVFVLGGSAGFILGRGDLQRSLGLADTDQRIEQAFTELRRELEQERAISAGLRAISGRERARSEREREVIAGIGESTRQARMDAQSAISLGGGAADSIQKILVQVEIYNRYVGNIERQLAWYRDLSGNNEVTDP
jgi:hypothetical protein